MPSIVAGMTLGFYGFLVRGGGGGGGGGKAKRYELDIVR